MSSTWCAARPANSSIYQQAGRRQDRRRHVAHPRRASFHQSGLSHGACDRSGEWPALHHAVSGWRKRRICATCQAADTEVARVKAQRGSVGDIPFSLCRPDGGRPALGSDGAHRGTRGTVRGLRESRNAALTEARELEAQFIARLDSLPSASWAGSGHRWLTLAAQLDISVATSYIDRRRAARCVRRFYSLGPMRFLNGSCPWAWPWPRRNGAPYVSRDRDCTSHTAHGGLAASASKDCNEHRRHQEVRPRGCSEAAAGRSHAALKDEAGLALATRGLPDGLADRRGIVSSRLHSLQERDHHPAADGRALRRRWRTARCLSSSHPTRRWSFRACRRRPARAWRVGHSGAARLRARGPPRPSAGAGSASTARDSARQWRRLLRPHAGEAARRQPVTAIRCCLSCPDREEVVRDAFDAPWTM